MSLFILEGPDNPNLKGWRTYQLICDRKRAYVISLPINEEIAAKKYRAKFYPRGSWEDITKPVSEGVMPAPRREILEQIYGRRLESVEAL